MSRNFTPVAALLLLFSFPLAGACSQSTTNGCKSRSGNFLAHYVERTGGTCGAITDTVFDSSGHAAICKGTDAPTTDNCSVNVDETCTPTTGPSFKETGTSHWSTDGTNGTSVFTVTILNASGASQCTSTYDVTFTQA